MASAAAGGGALLAAATLLFVVWRSPDDVPVDAVVPAQPVFTPATWQPAVPAAPGAEAPAAPRADDADPITRAVQRRLKRAGCYGGPVNGIWTAATRGAMGAFTEIVNARLPVDRADPVLLALLDTHPGVTCRRGCDTADGAACPPAPSPRRERLASLETGHVETRSAPDTIAPEADGDEKPAAEPPGASGFEEGAAAVAAAAAAVPKSAKADRPHARRKYRKRSSFPGSVSRSLRKLQRSVRAILW